MMTGHDDTNDPFDPYDPNDQNDQNVPNDPNDLNNPKTIGLVVYLTTIYLLRTVCSVYLLYLPCMLICTTVVSRGYTT